MESDNYTSFVREKLRLAVAIAVIRNKPGNISNDEYIEQLREKIRPQEEMDAISIGSEDFLFSDEETLSIEKHVIARETNASPTILDDFDLERLIHPKTMENLTQIPYENTERLENANEDNTQINNLNQNMVYEYSATHNHNEILDQGHVDITNIQITNNLHDSQMKTCDAETEIQDISKDLNRNNVNKQPIVDSQATIIYTLNEFQDNYTHVSQTQDINIINIEKRLISNNIHKPIEIASNSNEIEESSNGRHNPEVIQKNNEKVVNLKDAEIINKDSMILVDGESEDKESDTEGNQGECEVIPFKVIKELNKIKSYLSRRERRSSCDASSDSGYRSDSQKSSYQLSLQSLEKWVNQSAHCIVTFLIECPLAVTTLDMSDEMSQVLAELIDRLHSEENYPPFLDEILENVDLLLKEIYERTCEEYALKKDELLHRFLLLNKSIHIITYCLEKHIQYLEQLYENLTSTEYVYEINNLNETNNASYIFHILEILLQRYVKQKEVEMSQPNSQTSNHTQKKMDISDIWKKKWNPNYKCKEIIEEAPDKKCITEKIANILNKIVVHCMGGYSLVSYAALQCFNVLQR